MTRDSSWWRYDSAAQRLSLTLHVQPGARRNEIVGLRGEALKIRIAAPPVDNKANAALIDFLGETLGVPRSAIAIRHGAAGRRKVVDMTCGPELVTRLETLE